MGEKGAGKEDCIIKKGSTELPLYYLMKVIYFRWLQTCYLLNY